MLTWLVNMERWSIENYDGTMKCILNAGTAPLKESCCHYNKNAGPLIAETYMRTLKLSHALDPNNSLK